MDLLQWITSDNRTGCLILKREAQERRVYFKKGRVISFSSSDERDRFGQFLIHAGFLTPVSLTQVLEEQGKTRKALGRALVDLGIMTEADVKSKLRMHAMELCTALFLWKDGDFEFVHQEVDERDFVAFAISPDEILLEGHRRIDEWGRIKSVFPRDDMVPKLDPERALKALTTYEGSSVEYMLLEHIDGRRTIRDLYSGIPASEFVLYEALHRLHAEGTISVSDKPVVRDITGEFIVKKEAAAIAAGPERTEEVALPAASPPAPPEPPRVEPPKPPATVEPPRPEPPKPEPPKAAASKAEGKKKEKEKDRGRDREAPKPAPAVKVPAPAEAPAAPPPKRPEVKPEPAAAPAAPAPSGGGKTGLVVGVVAFLAVVAVVVVVMMRGGTGEGPGPSPSPSVTPATTAPTTPPVTAPPTTTTPPTSPSASPVDEAAELARQAEAHLGQQKLAEAEDAARAALALDPANAQAKGVLTKVEQLQTQGKAGQIVAQARAQERAGNLDAAEKLYRDALAADPGNTAADQGLKSLATKREKEKVLLPALEAVEAQIKKGDAAAARAELAKAEAADRTDPRVLKAKAAVQALEDKAREAESKQRAAALLAEGAKALDAGDVAKAEQALAEARGLDKGNPQVTALEARIKAAKDKPAGRVDVGEPLLTGVGYAPLQFSSRGVPEFPAAALASKTQGKVMVSVQVAPDGSVKDAKLVKSAPAETGFNEAALKAAKGWKFQPPTKDGGGEATEDTMWSVVVKFEP